MRKRLLVGACAVALMGGAASAQFAADRTSAPFGGGAPLATPPKPGVPQLPGGVVPAGGSAPAAPDKMLPSGFVLPDPTRKEPLKPIPSTTTTTLDAADQKFVAGAAVTAEHGNWMICVKSYSGPDSLAKAAALAKDIRKTHNTQSLLFERNAEERKAEQARVEATRKAENDKAQPFFAIVEEEERKARASGMQFMESKPKLKINRPYHETPEQWAVLIGGFKTVEDAKAALAVVAKLPAPKDTSLLDMAGIGGEQKTGKGEQGEWKSAWNYINCYACAMVVPNPKMAAANMEEKAKLEPYVVKLNDGVENSLLKVKKPWTLIVKTYSMPTRRADVNGEKKTVFDKLTGKGGSSAADLLQASGAEAEMLAKALRNPEMKPRSYDAYVLHHRHGSIVTVGAFDTPDDPALLKMQQELLGITFEMRDKDKKPVAGPDGKPLVQRLFDGVSLYPVPKY